VAEGTQARDDRTHAGATDVVDREAGLTEGTDHAEVSEAAGTTSAEHQAGGLSPDSASNTCDIAGRWASHADVVHCRYLS
jgi:hypothetical protein